MNGLSHEFPIQIGGIYHHLCKDNSITNLMMATILFYLFKELNFKSGLINKAASCVFAVFALNNSLVTVLMEGMEKTGLQSPDGVLGFLLLAGIVLGILVCCLLVGALREGILGKVDRKISEIAQNLFDRVLTRIQGGT